MARIYFARAMEDMDAREILRAGESVAELLDARGLQLVDPFLEVDRHEDTCAIKERAREIVERDLDLLRTVDAVLMDCSIPGRSYIGCICELVYAYLWNIPVVVYVGSSNNDKRYWLQYHAPHICRTQDEAINILASFFEADQSGRVG